jgi:hypothetical protein
MWSSKVCRHLSNGGDHESRKFIAEQLVEAVRKGRTTLGELTLVGKHALEQFRSRPEPA